MINSLKISICIPAFNRPLELLELLDSIDRQQYKPFEVIICEDNSPQRLQIFNVVKSFKQKTSIPIRYFENKKNLGYSANLRRCISLSKGDYVFLSGNDDILSKDSLKIVANKISKYKPEIIIRSYASFYKKLKNNLTEHKYVKDDYLVEYSKKEAAWLFYRSVLVSGLVFKSKSAKILQSNIVDATLYYQNYLLVKMFKSGSVLYIPDILVYNRIVDAGDFGSSEIEAKSGFEPGKRTIQSSIITMKGFFSCAKQVEIECQIEFLDYLKKIASAYSYPVIAYHADKPLINYFWYIFMLRKLGYGGGFFYGYAIILKVLGSKYSDKILSLFRFIFGYTKRIV